MFFAESAYSCSPVASVKVRTSNRYCQGWSEYFLPVSKRSNAVSSFSSGVLAMPLGPMHIATAGSPYFCMRGHNLWNLEPFPSRFIELMIGFPGICFMAASITVGSVESITSGASISRLSRFTSLVIIWLSSLLSVVATHTSRQWAPSST